MYWAAALDPLCRSGSSVENRMVAVIAAGTKAARTANTRSYGAMKDGGTTARTDDLIARYSPKGPTLFDHYAEPDIPAPTNKLFPPSCRPLLCPHHAEPSLFRLSPER